MLCSGMEMRTRLGFIYSRVLGFQGFRAVFRRSPSKVALLERQQLLLSWGSLQTWYLLPPSETRNPRWEQRAPTRRPSSAFSKTHFRADQTWN